MRSTVPCIQSVSRPEDLMTHDYQESWTQHDPLLLYVLLIWWHDIGQWSHRFKIHVFSSVFPPFLYAVTVDANAAQMLHPEHLPFFQMKDINILGFLFYENIKVGKIFLPNLGYRTCFPSTSRHMKLPYLWLQLHTVPLPTEVGHYPHLNKTLFLPYLLNNYRLLRITHLALP